MKIKDLTLMVAFTSILALGDYFFTFIPGIQIVFLIMFVMFQRMKFINSIMVIVIYVLIDNMTYGGIGLYTIPMMAAWLIVALLFYAIKNRNFGSHKMAVYSMITSFAYSLPFLLTTVLIYDITIMQYVINDIPFTMGTALSSYFTISLFYERLTKIGGW